MDMWNTPMVQKTTFDIQVDGKGGPGRPKMTWKQLTERDCRECTCMLIKTSANDDDDTMLQLALYGGVGLPSCPLLPPLYPS